MALTAIAVFQVCAVLIEIKKFSDSIAVTKIRKQFMLSILLVIGVCTFSKQVLAFFPEEQQQYCSYMHGFVKHHNMSATGCGGCLPVPSH